MTCGFGQLEFRLRHRRANRGSLAHLLLCREFLCVAPKSTFCLLLGHRSDVNWRPRAAVEISAAQIDWQRRRL